MEAKLQSEIIRWLKSKGAYVIKTRPGAGTPVGCPDIIFLYEKVWGAIECKATHKAPYQPGQQYTLDLLGDLSEFVYTVHPDSWAYVKEMLSREFF
jgi:hypothetical protein